MSTTSVLSIPTAEQIDQTQASAYAAAAAQAGVPAANLGTGSQFGPIFYAQRLIVLQQLQQVVVAEAIARLSTSYGADVDSFVAPFGLTRLSASSATGQVLCSTNSVTQVQIIVPVGANFGTYTGNLVYTVVADSTNSNYIQELNGYVIAAGQSSVSVTVQCTTSGTVGNAGQNQITQLLSSGSTVNGISAVTNPAAFTSAIDNETDSQLRARFQLTISGGFDGGTVNAISAVVLGTQPGLTYSVADLTSPAGNPNDYGYFTVVVNQVGATSGASNNLIGLVQANVNAIRSAGISFSVISSTVVSVTLAFTIVVDSTGDPTACTAAAIAACQAYIDSIGLDPLGGTTTCSFAQVYRAILQSDSDIIDVTGLTMNGGTTELTTGFAHQFSPGQISVTATVA